MGDAALDRKDAGPPPMTKIQTWTDRASAAALVISLAALPMAVVGFFTASV